MWDIFLASARLEWQRLRDDRWDFAMTFVVPMLAIGLIWWVFSAGLAQRLPIGVLDSDHSALSRQAVRMLQASQGLDVQQHYQNMAQVEAAMRSGHVAAVLVVPAGLERHVKTGRATRVTLIHNAQWSMPSGLIQRDVRSAIGTLSAGVEIAIRTKRGQSPQQARTSFSPISTHMVGLFNVSSNYQEFLASNLMPALLHILAMTAGAWAIGRRLRDRTIGDWLHSVIPTAPADAHALRYRDVLAAMLGKASWATLGMMAAASVAFTLMTGRIFAPFSHWVATWTGIYLLTALSVALGMFAAAATMSLRMALSITGFITAPAFAFSGVAYPLLAMPAGAQIWANLLPLTHYLQLQISMLPMRAPLHYAVPPLAGMALAALTFTLLAAWALLRASRLPQRWGAR